MSFVTDVMSPGGGVMLIPFVRLVIGFLLMLTTAAFIAGIARIHMVILTILGGGLLFSISFFESEYKKARARVEGAGSSASSSSAPSKPSSNTSAGRKEAPKTD